MGDPALLLAHALGPLDPCSSEHSGAYSGLSPGCITDAFALPICRSGLDEFALQGCHVNRPVLALELFFEIPALLHQVESIEWIGGFEALLHGRQLTLHRVGGAFAASFGSISLESFQIAPNGSSLFTADSQCLFVLG